MKQHQAINAYNMLEKLSENEHLSAAAQWEIYKLRKLLRPRVEFQQEREEAIREKYRPFANEQGTLEGEKSLEFMKELQALSYLDAEIEPFERPKIETVQGITCKTMEPLEEFIEFTRPAE